MPQAAAGSPGPSTTAHASSALLLRHTCPNEAVMMAPVVSLKHSSSEPLVLLADIGFDAVRARARRGKRRRARPSYARARAAGSRAYAHKCAC